MGGGKAGREGGHRTHQHYDDDDDDDDRSMFCSDFVASYRTMGKKNRNQTRCFRHHHHILHTLLKVGS